MSMADTHYLLTGREKRASMRSMASLMRRRNPDGMRHDAGGVKCLVAMPSYQWASVPCGGRLPVTWFAKHRANSGEAKMKNATVISATISKNPSSVESQSSRPGSHITPCHRAPGKFHSEAPGGSNGKPLNAPDVTIPAAAKVK